MKPFLFAILVYNIIYLCFSFLIFASDSHPLGKVDYAPDRILIKLKAITLKMQNDLNEQQIITKTYIKSIDVLNERYRVRSIEPLMDVRERDRNLSRIFIFRIPLGTDITKIAKEYSDDPMIEYAELDYIGQGGSIVLPNDSRFSEQWSLNNIGQNGGKKNADIDAIEAWSLGKGNNKVLIAVLDTGIDLQHPDLKAKIIQGFDFVNSDDDPQDDNGHGTSIAGIIGAETNNNEGIAGICWHCTILPVKVLDASKFGFYSWWSKGIIFAVEQKADVIVMSLGGDKFSNTLKDAVDFAYNNGAIIISITHNFGNDTIYYPGGYDNAIAVGATDMNDERWVNSNFGEHIDVVAPGVSILTTTRAGGYSRWTGTSQSAAHVAGLAGLIISLDSDLSSNQIRNIIEETADDRVGTINEDTPGWDRYYGHGRINAYKALKLARDFYPTVVKSKMDKIVSTWGYIKSINDVEKKHKHE